MYELMKQVISYLILFIVVVEAVWFVSDPMRRHYIASQIPIEHFSHGYSQESVYQPFIPRLIRSIANPPAPPSVVVEQKKLVVAPVKSPFDIYAGGVNSCFQPLKGSGKNKSDSSKIYRWVDENGKVHFGDDEKNKGSVIHGNRAPELSITVNVIPHDSQPNRHFQNNLAREARSIYNILLGILPREQLRPVYLDIVVLSSYRSLKDYKTYRFSKEGKGTAYQRNSQAVAYVSMHRGDDVDRSVKRELTYSIVTALVGSVPQWLGEGLASYIGYLEWNNMNSAIARPRGNFSKGYIKDDDFIELMNMDHRTFQQSKSWSLGYFEQSYSLFYFLKSHQEGKQLITRLFKHYSHWDCHPDDIESVLLENYPGGSYMLMKRYNRWLENKKFSSHSL